MLHYICCICIFRKHIRNRISLNFIYICKDNYRIVGKTKHRHHHLIITINIHSTVKRGSIENFKFLFSMMRNGSVELQLVDSRHEYDSNNSKVFKYSWEKNRIFIFSSSMSFYTYKFRTNNNIMMSYLTPEERYDLTTRRLTESYVTNNDALHQSQHETEVSGRRKCKRKKNNFLLKDNKNHSSYKKRCRDNKQQQIQLTNWIQTSMTNPSRTLHFPKA